MSSPEGTQSVRREHLRKGIVGALTSVALLGSAAVIGVWNPDGSGVELMRDTKGAVASRDPETEASDVAHPADESDLDNFALYLNGALTGLAAVASANCQQQ